VNEGLPKAFCFGALRWSGALAAAERFARGAPILAYHGVTDRPSSPLGNVRRLHVPAICFEQHLCLLAERWHPVPLSAIRDATTGTSLPPRSVAVTFDDGYRNLLTVALPLLRRYRMPATVFVLTGPITPRLWMDRLEAAVAQTREPEVRWEGLVFSLGSDAGRRQAMVALFALLDPLGEAREEAVDRLCQQLGRPRPEADDDRDLLTWDEVRLLRQAGLEIGSHAGSHEPLTRVHEAAVTAMLKESRERLVRELGAGAYPFAYPWGAWSPRIAGAVREAGFMCAVTTDARLNRQTTDCFALGRQLVGADDDATRLRAALTGFRALWTSR
jgi:peptidoglycan/xylan/chitin deacetylase (PgdA/CDA1 family)